MKITKHNKVSWIDFDHPSENDTIYLQENFPIHPLAIEEFITPTFRPKATQYDNCIFLTIHIPLFDVNERTTYPGELDIILTKTHLLTGHPKNIFQLERFFDQLQKSDGKRRLYMGKSPAHLLYQLLYILMESCFPRLDHITKNIDAIEEQIFRGHERAMVREISIVKRDILSFRRTLMPQRSVLDSLIAKNTLFIPADIKPYFQDLIGTNIRLWNTLESAKETIASLEETNNSLLSDKINQKMKVVTIFSAILLPVTLYANIFSINVDIPWNQLENGFWIHMGNMVFLSLLTILLFRLKRWTD